MQFSVIIPTFNRAYCLKKAIDSVLKQSFRDFELIVIDDGSTDETSSICKEYSKQLIYIHTKNLGVSAARNLGVQKAHGKYVAFLDSDDEWLENKLFLQNNYLIKNPLCKLVHGEEIWIRKGKRVNPKLKHQKSGGNIFEKCLKLCLISPSAVVIDRSYLISKGCFKEEFIVCEDYDLWLRITCEESVGYIETPIINKYGGHEDQLSSKFKAMDYWRIKSMVDLLRQNVLNKKQLEQTRKELKVKYTILKNGYLKHNRMQDCRLLEDMVSCVQ